VEIQETLVGPNQLPVARSQLFKLLTGKRWELLNVLTGAGSVEHFPWVSGNCSLSPDFPNLDFPNLNRDHYKS